MDNLPIYSIDLIKQLDLMYPPKHPTLDMPDRSIWFEAGRRSVVDSLLTRIQTGEASVLPSILNKKD